MHSIKIVPASSSEPQRIVTKIESYRAILESEKAKLGDAMSNPQTGKSFLSFQSASDPFKYAKFLISDRYNTPSVTPPWLKMIEMLSGYDIFNKLKHIVGDRADIITYDNVGLPGAFILAIIHAYFSTHREVNMLTGLKWFANSQGSDRDPLEIFTNYSDSDKWLCSSTDTTAGVQEVVDWFTVEDDEIDVHLYTSDKGVDLNGKYDKQEELHVSSNYGQVCAAMGILVEGGCMITKQFTISTIANIFLLERLADCFESFYICKPESSSSTNSEVFLVGVGFRKKEGRELYYKLLKEIEHPPNYCVDMLTSNKYLKSIYQASTALMKFQIDSIQCEMKMFQTSAQAGCIVNNKSKNTISNWIHRVNLKSLDSRDWLDVVNQTEYQIKIANTQDEKKGHSRWNKS